MNSLIRPFTILVVFAALVLSGCSGSSSDSGIGNNDSSNDSGSGDSGSDSGSNNDTGPTQGVSYLPLSVYEAYDEFSGEDRGGTFSSDSDPAYVISYLINPIDAATQETISTAETSDYSVTVDGLAIDGHESFPMLQKVIGNTIHLRTALVFDLSQSMYQADISALINEAKAYVADAQGYTGDASIATQEFTVWAFGSNTEELTGGFTSQTDDINAALDLVVARSQATDASYLGSASNLHRAVVEAIGRYTDEDEGYDFGDSVDNDLIDYSSKDGIWMSQLVIFSSGPDTYLEFNEELFSQGIGSQRLIKYGEDAGTETFINKPVFYYVVGGDTNGDTYQLLSDTAEVTTNINLISGTSYSFSSSLIANQIAAIDTRIDRDNQYVFRYALLPRIGEHTSVFQSSNAIGHNYSLTTTYEETETTDDLNDGIGSPYSEYINGGIVTSLVEITGPNGEYISNARASLATVSSFLPATRWVNNPPSDYSWSLTNGTFSVSGDDGTVTISSISDGPSILTLTSAAYGSTSILLVD